MRLSWPKDGNRKRAIMEPSVPAVIWKSQRISPFFINTTSNDVEDFHRSSLKVPLLNVTSPAMDLWRQPRKELEATVLLDYCKLKSLTWSVA